MSDDSGPDRKRVKLDPAALQKAFEIKFLFEQIQDFEKMRDEQPANSNENSEDNKSSEEDSDDEIYFPDGVDRFIERLQVTICDELKEESCGICNVKFSSGSEIFSLPCKHGFHKDCLKSFLTRKDTCPRCYETIYEDTKDENTVPDKSMIGQSEEKSSVPKKNISKLPVTKCDESKDEDTVPDKSMIGQSEEKTSVPNKNISKLPVTKCNESKDEPCNVCKEKFSLGDTIYTLPCKHEFHNECASVYWDACPICNEKIYDAKQSEEAIELKKQINAEFAKMKPLDRVMTLLKFMGDVLGSQQTESD